MRNDGLRDREQRGDGRNRGERQDRTGPSGGATGSGGGNPARGSRRPEIPGLAARRLATDILAKIVEKNRPLDMEFDSRSTTPAFRNLAPKDRAFVRAMVSTALRRLGQIDDVLRRLIEKPLPDKADRVVDILRIGVAQILFLDVPDHAAVSLSVTLTDEDRIAKAWKGLVNGVLRTLARRKDEILADQDAAALNTPDWLFESWTAAYGPERARAIAEAHLTEAALDLTVKSDPARWAAALGGAVLPTGSVRLAGGGAIDKLEGFLEGEWWVQDAAAALPARLLGDVKGRQVADLCAAPGGKTAELAAAGAEVTAVDLSPERLERVKQNMGRLRLPNVRVVAADLETWTPKESFDAILLDAPCSATGTIRRHPDVMLLKSPEDVATLAALQKRLLERVSAWVKPGGALVYCTCSLQPEEGEAQIEAFLAAGAPFRRLPVRPEEIGGLAQAITLAGDLRTLPFHMPATDAQPGGCDGFFAARLIRNES
jgi:16S rRNA (cytosine967-C5)-methyltransferase